MSERESIARYFEHLAHQDIGTLIDAFTPREALAFAASWVRNELDVKWADEVRATTSASTDGQK